MKVVQIEDLGLQSGLRVLGTFMRVTIASDNQGLVDHTAREGLVEARAHETPWAAHSEG